MSGTRCMQEMLVSMLARAGQVCTACRTPDRPPCAGCVILQWPCPGPGSSDRAAREVGNLVC